MAKEKVKSDTVLKKIQKEGESFARSLMDRMIKSGNPQDVEKFKAISKVRDLKKKDA